MKRRSESSWKRLPTDIIDIILEYDGTIRKRNGKYMNQLTKERMINVCDRLLHIPKIQIHDRTVSNSYVSYGVVKFTNTKFILRKYVLDYVPIILNETQEDVYGWTHLIYKIKINLIANHEYVYDFIKIYTLFDHLYERMFVTTGDTIGHKTRSRTSGT